MSDVIVVGAGPSGLAAATLMARSGLEVTVLERSPNPPPDTPAAAWEEWDRRPVAQFRQAHILLPRGYQALNQNLPEVVEQLRAAGGVEWNGVAAHPPSIEDWEDLPGDSMFDTVTARRPVIDWAFSTVAENTPGLAVRRGAVVNSLLFGESAIEGVPHVAGVSTSDGDMDATLVIDASGRRTAIPQMLSDGAGVAPAEHKEDSGFAYYTRFFQSGDGSIPVQLAGLLSPIGSISVLTLPGDNGAWSVTIYGSAADRALRAVTDPDVFSRVVAACPAHAHWLEGTPVTGVDSITSVVDRRFDYQPNGDPVATGVLALGDAWGCTNPSVGRGISLGVGHAIDAVGIVREGLADPAQLAGDFWRATAERHEPWHTATLQADRVRLDELETFRAGGIATVDPNNPVQAIGAAFVTAAMANAEVFRAFIELTSALALPEELLARPGLLDKILEGGGGADPPQAPGPSRDELVALLS